jgi:hypothetical protein
MSPAESKVRFLKDLSCRAPKFGHSVISNHLSFISSIVASPVSQNLSLTNMSHSEEAQKITLDKFIKAFSDFSAEGQLACFPDDYKQRTLPLSLGIPGRGKKEAAHALPKLEEAVKNVKVSGPVDLPRDSILRKTSTNLTCSALG